MTLPSTPPISIQQILAELGRAPGDNTLSGRADERALSGVASGPISFSDYLGKSMITAGSQTFNNNGTFTVPNYNTMTVTVNGAGCGGGGSTGDTLAGNTDHGVPGDDGGTGGQSAFGFSPSPTANGGTGGKGGTAAGAGADGSNAGGSNGTVTSGGGGAGGAAGTAIQELSGGHGGNGGKVVKTYAVASGPVPGSNVSITVGASGAPGASHGSGGSPGGAGAKGSVTVSWS
ncbi:MAG: hypothetical protein J0H60_19975 [Rhizobiales bacterium]|nr:hypothetical protein [Hyphomicrobiales bacterium]